VLCDEVLLYARRLVEDMAAWDANNDFIFRKIFNCMAVFIFWQGTCVVDSYN